MAPMKMGAIVVSGVFALSTGLLGFLIGSAWATAQAPKFDDPQAVLFAGLLAAAIALATALIAIWGVYSSRVIARRQATIEHLARQEADQITQRNIQAFIRLTRGRENLAHWADEDQQGSDQALTIISILNDYELLAVGIKNGVFEYDIVCKWNATTIRRYWQAAHPFVIAIRNRVGAPSLWAEFELLNNWVSGVKRPFWSLWWTGFG
jgi:hypothetical protein